MRLLRPLLLATALLLTVCSAELARHEATFTTFCDHGSIENGDCECKGGSATAAIGDGSWLWHELVGAPCEAQPDDRCDCSSTCVGGGADDCPHGAGVEGATSDCWQCEGVNAPQCNPSDELKRCEVEVHGTHGSEKYYITEVCPSQHPCNRCKAAPLQRCAAWAPLAVDLCGTTWHLVFERSRAEATGHVTLSCYPHKYAKETEQAPSPPPQPSTSSSLTTSKCYSLMPEDIDHFACEEWCRADAADDHCRWCKCRGCASMADKCAPIVREVEASRAQRAALLASCGDRLDCLTWCNEGNCKGDCRCAECGRCGPDAQMVFHATAMGTSMLSSPAARNAAKATHAAKHSTAAVVGGAAAPAVPTAVTEDAFVPAACHGWCLAGAEDDPDVVCKSSKCRACPICSPRQGGQRLAGE